MTANSKKPRLLLALSGGVDSAVAAWKAIQDGYEVEAAYMKNWINEENVFGNCPWILRMVVQWLITLEFPFVC